MTIGELSAQAKAEPPSQPDVALTSLKGLLDLSQVVTAWVTAALPLQAQEVLQQSYETRRNRSQIVPRVGGFSDEKGERTQ